MSEVRRVKSLFLNRVFMKYYKIGCSLKLDFFSWTQSEGTEIKTLSLSSVAGRIQ